MADYTFQIFADSNCDLPESFYEENGVGVLNHMLVLDGTEYIDDFGKSISYEEVYRHIRAGEMASTVQVSMQTFLDRFTPALEAGRDVLYVGFSSALSGTFATSCMVAKELGEQYPERRLYMVDTCAACAGHGLLVRHAVRLQKEGKTIEEVRDWLESNKNRLCHWFTVDDLHYLHRGGRVSKTAAVVGSLVGIKPVMHVDNEGRLIPGMKVRGRKAALEMLVRKFDELVVRPEEQVVYLSHADSAQDAAYVEQLVREKYPVKDVVTSLMCPIIGAHSGPGTVALFFIGSRKF